MAWIEVFFETQSALAENASAALEALGALSVSFFDAGDNPLLEPPLNTTPFWDKVKIVGLFSNEIDQYALLHKLQTLYPTFDFTFAPLADKEWSRTWLDHFHPMHFGKTLCVVPTHTAVLRLDPGLAFGTGTHPTTALCLEWLATHSLENQTVIDYGCGSGILGIAALLLGAQKVWAVDHDPQALDSTKENAHRNKIDENYLIRLYPGDLPHTVHADTIVANILAEPLITLAPILKQHCVSQGKVILSGLFVDQCESVKAAYASWCTFEEPQVKEEWALLVGQAAF